MIYRTADADDNGDAAGATYSIIAHAGSAHAGRQPSASDACGSIQCAKTRRRGGGGVASGS